MAFNRKEKLRGNIEAIRTAFALDRERRAATEEERAVISRYCGFGGLKCILNPASQGISNYLLATVVIHLDSAIRMEIRKMRQK